MPTRHARPGWAGAHPLADRAGARPHPVLAAGADRRAGTNGWLSSWGTNAHGEIAGTPPAAAG